jgi:hypothetical protein
MEVNGPAPWGQWHSKHMRVVPSEPPAFFWAEDSLNLDTGWDADFAASFLLTFSLFDFYKQHRWGMIDVHRTARIWNEQLDVCWHTPALCSQGTSRWIFLIRGLYYIEEWSFNICGGGCVIFAPDPFYKLYILFIDLRTLDRPCIPGTRPTWPSPTGCWSHFLSIWRPILWWHWVWIPVCQAGATTWATPPALHAVASFQRGSRIFALGHNSPTYASKKLGLQAQAPGQPCFKNGCVYQGP